MSASPKKEKIAGINFTGLDKSLTMKMENNDFDLLQISYKFI